MPYLKQIAQAINLELKTNVFSDKRFASAEYYDIAYQLQVDNREDKLLSCPCVPKATVGEYYEMLFNDGIAFTAYHKILNSSYAEAENPKFGRAKTNIKATATMQMVFLINRQIVKILPEEFESVLVTNFVSGKETSFSSVSTAMSGIKILPSSTQLDYTALWNSEFKGYEFNVNADRSMMGLTYTIESDFKTGCFNLCDCSTEQ
jgi:hypothetical protein